MSRVFKRDGMYWIDWFDAKGKRRRKKVAPSKRVAGEALNAVLNSTAREEFLGIVDESKMSFADFAKLWRERVERRIRLTTAQRWLGILNLTSSQPSAAACARSPRWRSRPIDRAALKRAQPPPVSIARSVSLNICWRARLNGASYAAIRWPASSLCRSRPDGRDSWPRMRSTRYWPPASNPGRNI